jgi:hypothetical protein
MKLSKRMYLKHSNIINELEQIFNDYKYNSKIKKHFPASFNIPFEKTIIIPFSLKNG